VRGTIPSVIRTLDMARALRPTGNRSDATSLSPQRFAGPASRSKGKHGNRCTSGPVCPVSEDAVLRKMELN
jgi:hypothetical protein